MRETQPAIFIQRLASTTAIQNCVPALRKYLGLSEWSARGFPFKGDTKMPLIADFPHEVWQGKVGLKSPWIYAQSLPELLNLLTVDASVKVAHVDTPAPA